MGFSSNGVEMSMPVAPAYGYGNGFSYPPIYGNGYGNGLFGNNDILGVLFIIALCGGGLGGFGGGWGMDMMFPWMFTQQQMQDGFNQQQLNSQLNSLQNGQTVGFSNAEVSACNKAMNQMQTSYENQIASMQENFNNTRSIDTRLDGLSSQLAQCCCDNKSATNDLKYTIANESANTRTAINTAVQGLQDKLCQLEMDNYKAQLEQSRRDNIALQNKMNLAELEASQLRQTQTLENYIRPQINPAYIVASPYTPVNNCNQNCNGYAG
jgi:hypothetical protein